ncbi:hypothetical protein BC833DRAFT_566638 [Globomyces pollinis-pini]|nr:hypothetical protein BC833DRAFT_566638 [Globomyces pollinis-pini]
MQGLVSFVLMAAAVSGSVINPNQDCLSVCPSGYAVSYTEGIDATKGKTTCFCDDQAKLVQTCLKDTAFSVDNIKKCAESTGAKSSSVDGPAPQPDKQTQTTTTTKPNEVINPNQAHPAIKHIDIRQHFIRDRILNVKDISVQKQSTADMTADMFTKALVPYLFLKHRENLGMVTI